MSRSLENKRPVGEGCMGYVTVPDSRMWWPSKASASDSMVHLQCSRKRQQNLTYLTISHLVLNIISHSTFLSFHPVIIHPIPTFGRFPGLAFRYLANIPKDCIPTGLLPRLPHTATSETKACTRVAPLPFELLPIHLPGHSGGPTPHPCIHQPDCIASGHRLP